MPPLPARHVEDPRIGGQAEDVHDPRHVAPVLLEREDRLVLEQVLRVEVVAPPLRQKNTGSRYAPNTLSSAARISYSVQYDRAQSRMNGTTFSVPAAAARSAAMFRSQSAPSRVVRSFASARRLVPRRLLVDLQQRDRERVLLGHELVHADDQRAGAARSPTAGARRSRRSCAGTSRSRGRAPRRPVSAISSNIASACRSKFVRERLDVVRAAERIDHVRHAALEREHLLGAQRHLHRVLGGERERLVHRVRVQRLRAAEHRGHAPGTRRARCCSSAAAP